MNVGTILRTNFADMPSTPITGVRGVTPSEGRNPDLLFEYQREQSDKATDSTGLTISPEKQEIINELKARDAEVRAHEQAHASAGGGLTGGINYTFTKGPDNVQYATSGSVSIDTSPADSPEATIIKAQQIRSAALAPANPSPQDQSVAAAASQLQSQAKQEIAIEEQKEEQGTSSLGSVPSANLDASAIDSTNTRQGRVARTYAQAAEQSPIASSELDNAQIAPIARADTINAIQPMQASTINATQTMRAAQNSYASQQATAIQNSDSASRFEDVSNSTMDLARPEQADMFTNRGQQARVANAYTRAMESNYATLPETARSLSAQA